MANIYRILVVLLGSGLVWSPYSLAEHVTQPIEVAARVGGFFGSTYTITLEHGNLLCTEMRGNQLVKRHLVQPSPEQWTRFRAQLDALKIGSWQKSYLNPDVMDGTQWSVRIEYSDLSVVSEGSNNYPDEKGHPNGSPEETPTFHRFRTAFSILDKECKM